MAWQLRVAEYGFPSLDLALLSLLPLLLMLTEALSPGEPSHFCVFLLYRTLTISHRATYLVRGMLGFPSFFPFQVSCYHRNSVLLPIWRNITDRPLAVLPQQLRVACFYMVHSSSLLSWPAWLLIIVMFKACTSVKLCGLKVLVISKIRPLSILH